MKSQIINNQIVNSQIVRWGSALYKIQRDSFNIGIFVFVQRGEYPDGTPIWVHMYSKDDERIVRVLLERLVMEKLNLTEKKQIEFE